MRTLRRTFHTLCVTVALTAGAALLPGSAAAAPPTGTGAVTGAARTSGYPTLRDVRWSAHDTYDRIVFEFGDGTPAYRVAYGRLEGLGTGTAIPLAGAADLIVDFSHARAHDDAGRSTYPLRTRDPLLPMLRQLKWGGDYEGYVRAGLGLREKAGFRVLTLTSPARVVVDVGHFGFAPTTRAGTANVVSVDRIRAAKQVGWDRLVFDVRGTAKPNVSVRYSGDTAVVVVRMWGTSARSYAPTSMSFGYPGLRSVRQVPTDSDEVVFRVGTAKRHGFRVTVLTSPVRVVVDVAH